MWLMTFEVFYLKLVLNITSRSPAQTILELIRHDYLEMLLKRKKNRSVLVFFKRLKYVAPNQAKGANGTSMSHRGCARIQI